MTIEEGNKLIAEFMGVDTNDDVYFLFGPDLYDNKWDHLIPVVEKIEAMQVQIHIQNDACWVKKSFKPYFDISIISDISKIDAVWNAVVQFIQWYNQTIKK